MSLMASSSARPPGLSLKIRRHEQVGLDFAQLSSRISLPVLDRVRHEPQFIDHGPAWQPFYIEANFVPEPLGWRLHLAAHSFVSPKTRKVIPSR